MANAPAWSRMLGGRRRDSSELNCILCVPCVVIALLCHMCLLLVGVWLLCVDTHLEETMLISRQGIALDENRCVQCDPNEHSSLLLVCLVFRVCAQGITLIASSVLIRRLSPMQQRLEILSLTVIVLSAKLRLCCLPSVAFPCCGGFC